MDTVLPMPNRLFLGQTQALTVNAVQNGTNDAEHFGRVDRTTPLTIVSSNCTVAVDPRNNRRLLVTAGQLGTWSFTVSGSGLASSLTVSGETVLVQGDISGVFLMGAP